MYGHGGHGWLRTNMVGIYECRWIMWNTNVMVYGLWFMVYGLWFMVYGLWFRMDEGTYLGLKFLSKGKQKRQRQEKEVKLQREDSKSPQRHLHKCKKQTVKHTEKTNKKIKTNSTKTLNIKQISPLVPKAHNTTTKH